MSVFRLSTLFLFTLAIACGRTPPQTADSSAAASIRADRSSEARDDGSSVATTQSSCPRTGRWALCSVEKRLGQSGFVIKRLEGESPRRAGFSVPPAVYTLGRARLELFVYPDEATLARDIAKMDTVNVTPRGAANSWGISPTFARSGNLAAVFLTQNAQQAERLTLAITAGAPQR